jgi:hypothetical protein
MTFEVGFPSDRPAKSSPPQRPAQAYHALSVRPEPDACEARGPARARAIEPRRHSSGRRDEDFLEYDDAEDPTDHVDIDCGYRRKPK